MKRTYFIAMFVACLLGGQVFADDPTGTAVDNCEKTEDRYYYGKYSDSESVSGGNVTIKADEQGTVPNKASVYGGYTKKEGKSASDNTVTMQGGTVQAIYGGRAEAAEASNNTVTMQGGTVEAIYGGDGYTGASNNKVTMQGGTVSRIIYGGNGHNGDSYNNTVIMTGGSVKMIYGGASGNNYTPSGNVVIVTGGSITQALMAGNSTGSEARAQNNKVHLVGKGASNVTIADGQGITSTYSYTGDDAGISFAYVYGGYAPKGTSSGNSIDIYGTGITITQQLQYAQILTFNITNDAVTAQTPEVAVNLTSTTPSNALDLTDIDLQVKDLNVEEWSAGMTVTLVQSKLEIKGASEELKVGKVVDITDATGAKVAQGKLQIVNGTDGKYLLNLTVQGKVPEPATGTLSLLALAALAARRRKK